MSFFNFYIMFPFSKLSLLPHIVYYFCLLEEFPVSPTFTYPVGSVFLQPVQQFYAPPTHVVGPGVEEGN